MSDKLVLHWLNQSRSQRVVWLLEELGVEYELKLYKRTKGHRAPKELEQVHPLGKSPVLEVISANGKSQIIAETGHIISYLVRKYDTSGKLTPESDDEKEEVDYFLHYAEGTLQPFLVSLLVGNVAKQSAPFGTKFLVGQVVNQLNAGYYATELKKNFKYLDGILAAQHKNGSKYFVGNKLTAADIILYFPIHENVFGDPQRAKSFIGDNTDVTKLYPNLYQWSQSINKEPKLIQANEVIEKQTANGF